MMCRRNVCLAAIALVVIAGAPWGIAWWRRASIPAVVVEAVKRRDLQAIVSASGTIEPKRFVNISADTAGRVIGLVVAEGDRVKRGQFLLQIDPRPLITRVQSGQAGLQAARSSVEQIRAEVAAARVSLDGARQNLERQRDLWSQGLIAREMLDRAENEILLCEAGVKQRQQQLSTQEQRTLQEQVAVENARYDLGKMRVESPIDGVVTRRNIKEGEMANNVGTVLLTVADMTVMYAEVEVDEIDISNVMVGQPAKVTIDAMPDETFAGQVTEIGNSAIQQTDARGGTVRRVITFKVVVTVSEQIPNIRPGFTCTADITTAARTRALAIPIQAAMVRAVIVDARGRVIRQPNTERDHARGNVVEANVAAAELKGGETRKEQQGVFLLRDGHAVFVTVRTGIASERYFEALADLRDGDQVITGPFSSLRELADGNPVRLEEPKKPGWFEKIWRE